MIIREASKAEKARNLRNFLFFVEIRSKHIDRFSPSRDSNLQNMFNLISEHTL